MGDPSEQAHPIARLVFDHLARGAGGWSISPRGLAEIEGRLSETRGSIELVAALAALASIVEFIGTRDGAEVVQALVHLMLGFERDLKSINGTLGSELTEKHAVTARSSAEKLLGHFALARTLDRSPAPAGAARWWNVR